MCHVQIGTIEVLDILLKFWTSYYSHVQIETMEVLNIILLLSQVAERDSELDPVITALQSCR